MITIVPRRVSFSFVQLIEVYHPVLATSREPHIIMEPVNTHDFALMSMELEALGVDTRVKVVDIDVLLRNHASEQMSTVCELDLVATFEHYGSERNDLVTEHIAPYHLVL